VETREEVTVVSFDLSLPYRWSSRGNQAAAAVTAELKAMEGGSFADLANDDAKAFSHCSNVARMRSVGVVRVAEARAACPTGTSGADCRHFCAATWHRSAPLHDALLHGHSYNRAAAAVEAYEDDDALEHTKNAALGSSWAPAQLAVTGSKGSKSKAGVRQRTATQRGIHHAYVGPLAHDDKSLTMGAHRIAHCSFKCRAKTLSAIIACDDWTHGGAAQQLTHSLKGAWFQPLNLSSDFLV
jgi:hypothetical protein